MPINPKKYHPKWRLISYLIRFIRAGNRCEECGIRNYDVCYWNGEQLHQPQQDDAPANGFISYALARSWAKAYNARISLEYAQNTHRVSVVKLTVSHLDHDESHNRFANLMSRCQWCHLNHDRRDNAERRIYGPTGRHNGQLKLHL